ncbi:MAG: YiiX/YebB-like N1pC/P60 family cysteine hydrolase [Rickettsiella sp.]|nr:YiiX/YebB-like N1pC/P60 family cysteine hydrolase [Rickettsiella sp.]
MKVKCSNRILNTFIHWLNQEVEPIRTFPLSDFNKLKHELRPCDVLLIEGRKRISQIIKLITQTSWSHAALYIGRIYDIENKKMQNKINEFYQGDTRDQLIIESLLGEGTLISPLTKYTKEHIRICRPKNIAHEEAQKVINYTIMHLGREYDFRQIFDLGRFLLPWPLLPRKWHSTLFNYKPGGSAKESCAVLLTEAFQSVDFPIMPRIEHEGPILKFSKGNPRLFTPKDFDYSPYFEIIKYPMSLTKSEIYRNWTALERKNLR